MMVGTKTDRITQENINENSGIFVVCVSHFNESYSSLNRSNTQTMSGRYPII